jgi:hypothetical protein
VKASKVAVRDWCWVIEQGMTSLVKMSARRCFQKGNVSTCRDARIWNGFLCTWMSTAPEESWMEYSVSSTLTGTSRLFADQHPSLGRREGWFVHETTERLISSSEFHAEDVRSKERYLKVHHPWRVWHVDELVHY